MKCEQKIRDGLWRRLMAVSSNTMRICVLIAGTLSCCAADPLGIPAVPAAGAGRLDYFAQKVRSGAPVTIGYIGGSITQGSGASSFSTCYYWLSSRGLLSAITAHGGTGNAVLAAVGGTDSEYGAYRVGVQLLDQGVDLLIIEFAVNDGDSESANRGMEGIVRHTWRINPETAIVFLYTTTAGAVSNYYLQGAVMPTVLRHHTIAEYYGIAEVHSGPAVADGITQGLYTSGEFFADGVHPSDIGHAVYSNLLLNALLPTLDWENPATGLPPLPAPLTDDDLAYADWIKIEPSVTNGVWIETPPGAYTYTGGWKATNTASMTIPVKGKKIGVVFGNSNAGITISGLGFEGSFTGITQSPAWVPRTIWVYDESIQTEGSISIEIQPAAAGETLVALEGIKCITFDETVGFAPHALTYTESFENYPEGATLIGGPGWRAASDKTVLQVTNENYTAHYTGGTYPLNTAPHTKTLRVSNGVTNAIAGGTNRIVTVEYIARLQLFEELPQAASGVQLGLAVGTNGLPWVYHGAREMVTGYWSQVTGALVDTDDWVRVTTRLDYQTVDAVYNSHYARVWINNQPLLSAEAYTTNNGLGTAGGPWFALADASRPYLSGLTTQGNASFDDLLATDIDPDGAAADGTPIRWLMDNVGITEDYDAMAAADSDDDGAPNGAERIAGTQPLDGNSVFRVIRTGQANGINEIVWYGTTNGGVRTPFTMQRGTNLIGALDIVASNLTRSVSGTNVWYDTAPPPGGPVFYRPLIPSPPAP